MSAIDENDWGKNRDADRCLAMIWDRAKAGNLFAVVACPKADDMAAIRFRAMRTDFLGHAMFFGQYQGQEEYLVILSAAKKNEQKFQTFLANLLHDLPGVVRGRGERLFVLEADGSSSAFGCWDGDKQTIEECVNHLRGWPGGFVLEGTFDTSVMRRMGEHFRKKAASR